MNRLRETPLINLLPSLTFTEAMDILQQNQYLTTLTNGKIHVDGQFVWGSNYTFLVQVKYESIELAAVYKPSRGERPLWDFSGLKHLSKSRFPASLPAPVL